MSKHTPGPWKTYDWEGHLHVEATGRNEICRVANHYQTDGTTEANARLIAAAPELLQACEAALGLAEAMSEGDLYDQIKAAIAKTKGE